MTCAATSSEVQPYNRIEACILYYVIRQHCSTMYIGVAYCYRPNCMVCHSHEPCKNGWTDRDAIWVVDSGGPKEACVTWGHIGAFWRIRLNHLCAAAMWPVCQITLTTCYCYY